MDAYGIFQGGGAKGYAHVGALKAAEERGIRFIRYGGTSAGAIIAALAAAGYTADELLDPDKPIGRRGVLDLQLSALLNHEENLRIERLMSYGAKWRRGKSEPRGGADDERPSKRRIARILGSTALAIKVPIWLWQEWATIAAVRRDFGLLGTDEIVDWIDRRLAAKIGCARPVTFADLGMRLRVVAANLSTGRIETFGLPGHEERAVAPATMASACFPIFFRPVIADDLFVDGGMLSNLPAWIFDDERDDETVHVPTFGFRLVNGLMQPDAPPFPKKLRTFLKSLIGTVLSGGANFEERGIEYYHPIDLTASVDTLSFSEARTQAPKIVREAKRSVHSYFEDNIGPQDPLRMARVLALVGREITSHFDWAEHRVRLHVLLPDADGRHARTVYSSGIGEGADDHLRVRTDVDGAGAVFRLKEPIYFSFDHGAPASSGALRYELAARPSWLAGLHAVPIFDNLAEWKNDKPRMRLRPFAALVIDASINFADLIVDEAEQDFLANVAAIIGEAIRNRSIVRAARANAPSTGPRGWDRTYGASPLRLAARKVRDAGDDDFGRRLGLAISRLP